MECPECKDTMFITEKGYKCNCGHREAISRPVGRPTKPSYKFKKFVFTHSRGPYISIRKNGMFWFNPSAVERYGLGDCHFIILHYDEVHKAVGFLPVNKEDEEGAIPLLKEKNRGKLVCCKSFFDYYKIRVEKGRKLNKIEKEGDMVIVRIQ